SEHGAVSTLCRSSIIRLRDWLQTYIAHPPLSAHSGPLRILQTLYTRNTTSEGPSAYDGDVQAPVPPVPPTEGVTRRNFYIAAIYGLSATIAAALGLPAAIYLLFPPKIRRAEEWIEIGDITRLATNSPTEMTFRRNRIDG